MKKMVLLYTILFLLSCTRSKTINELEASYKTSINLFERNIKEKGKGIIKQVDQDPDKAESYFKKWVKLDSIRKEIDLFIADTINSKNEIDFYNIEINKIYKVDSDFCCRYLRYDNDSNVVEESNNNGSIETLTLLSKKEIQISTLPKLIVSTSLLAILESFSRYLLGCVTPLCDWKIQH